MMTVVNLGLLQPKDGFGVNGGASSHIGYRLSSGDFNHDGYSDLVVDGNIIDGHSGSFSNVTVSGSGSGAVSAGDVNGDGFDDFVSGSPQGTYSGYGYGYYSYAGITWVSFNGPDGGGFQVHGIDGSYSGTAVSGAGDINGDGFADILIGAPYDGSHGAVYVIFGKSSGFADIELGSLDPADGIRIGGATNQDIGYSVAPAGDMNGDGFDDIFIRARSNTDPNDLGTAYVLFGKEAGLGNFDLGSLTASSGFKITPAASYSISQTASAGDVNGDGFDDIIVTTRGTTTSETYVIFGKATGLVDVDLSSISASQGFKIVGTAWSVASAGDFNGDGFDDIIIGGPDADQAYGTNAGGAWLIYGKASGFADIALSSLAETDGFTIIGDEYADQAGMAVGAAGDLNGDGFDDIMIGAPGRDNSTIVGVAGKNVGEVYILFGHADVGVVKAGTDAADTLSGSNQADTLDGRGGADILSGFGGADTLIGGSGADLLDGGTGADLLIGGAGTDTFVVDDAGDLVVERANEGFDTVQASISYALESNVEKLVLTGSAAINGTGNSLANTIIGNSGANVLDGGAGKDTMNGGGGNDTYIVSDVGDKAIESSASGGIDLVKSAISFTLGANVENLTLTGTGAINGTGNTGINVVTGNASANVLKGLGGNDTLYGMGGNDTIYGGNGNDTLNGGGGSDLFVFDSALSATANVDKIQAYSVIDDTIALDQTIFKALTTLGTLDDTAFFAGTAAHDADDRIIYDAHTGYIYYDKDGSGAAMQVLFAQITPGTLLTHEDLLVIA